MFAFPHICYYCPCCHLAFIDVLCDTLFVSRLTIFLIGAIILLMREIPSFNAPKRQAVCLKFRLINSRFIHLVRFASSSITSLQLPPKSCAQLFITNYGACSFEYLGKPLKVTLSIWRICKYCARRGNERNCTDVVHICILWVARGQLQTWALCRR